MKHIRTLLALSIGMCVGALGVFAWQRSSRPVVPTGWLTLSKTSYGLANDVVMNSDIPPPGLHDISGRIKFLPPVDARGLPRLGYHVTFRTDALDKKHLPEKYKRSQRMTTPAGETYDIEPLEQATFEAELTVVLLDHDGFELSRQTSNAETFQTGASVSLQGTVPEPISTGIAALTKTASVDVHVKRCLSCQ